MNETPFVTGMGTVTDEPNDMLGIVIVTKPSFAMTVGVGVVIAAPVDDAFAAPVDDEEAGAQLLHVTDVENAFTLSPNCRLIVADELEPPTVIVHDKVVDAPTPIVMPELEVGSPEHVKPLGQVNA